MSVYYTQPIDFKALMEGKEQPTCNLHQSVAQRLHLILITNMKEFRYNLEFGCIIWEHDFENVPNINQWKDRMAKAVKEILDKYESRLQNIKTSMELTEEEFISQDKEVFKKVKRRIDIIINANLKKTNEPFFFKEVLYVSPVWIE